MRRQNRYLWKTVPKMGSSSTTCAWNQKKLEKVRFKMWSQGENESFNAEFIWNDILVN
jgi:hypothetical protein